MSFYFLGAWPWTFITFGEQAPKKVPTISENGSPEGSTFGDTLSFVENDKQRLARAGAVRLGYGPFVFTPSGDAHEAVGP